MYINLKLKIADIQLKKTISLFSMAACGFAATSTSGLIFNLKNNYQLALLMAFASMIDYHLQWQNAKTIKEVITHYSSKYLPWTILSVLVAVGFWNELTSVQLLFLAHLCILAFFYGYGLEIERFKLPPLRTINYLKIFLIVYVWVAATLWIPLLGKDVSLESVFVETAQRSLFYLGLTLPFDIRDKNSDKIQNLKTLANTLGDIKTKWLSTSCLIMSLTIAVTYYEGFIFYSILFSHSICFILILLVSKSKSLLYYTVLIDGTIVLQYVSMQILKNIS